MAKKPTTSANDPAALAFSAVEDALKDSVFSLDESVDERTPHPQFRDNRERTERLRAADKMASQTGTVANDDRFQGTRILYGLQSKSSPRATYIAIGLSIVWVVAVILAEFLRLKAQDNGAPLFSNSLELVGFLAILVLPPAGFFAIATLIRRAQELRLAATSITQAAVRLAEPETTASEKVATVGQAVRREVNALGDGLERALSRAGELEVMIHNEVTALERTYSETNRRMRALIQELASQRDSVITNTDRVREAITESHTGLVFDLDMISQRIAGTIVESGGNLTRALETAGNGLTSAFGERTESFVQLVDNRTNDLMSSLDESANRLNLTLEDRTAALSQSFEGRTYELSSVIEGRMNSLVDAFDSRSSGLTTAIDDRTSSLAKLLAEGGSTLLDQLRDRGHEVSGALDLTGARIANDISQRAKEAEELFGALAQQLDESVAVNVNAMESRLHSALIEISGNLDETTERARITLSGAGTQTLSQFESRMDEISGTIDTHISGLESMEGRLQTALLDIGTHLDEASEKARNSLHQAGAQTLLEFDAKIDEIAGVIDARVQGLESVIGDKGERLAASLDRHTTSFAARANVLEMALDEKSGHFNDLVGQRIKQITDTIANRTNEMTDSLESHTNIIADALDNRVQLLNDTMRGRTDEFASALDNRTEFLNDSLDQRTKLLTSTLEDRTKDLSSALDGRTKHLAQAVESRLSEINSTLEGHSDVLNNTLDQRTRQLASTLDSRTQQLASAIATRSTELSEALGTRTQQLSDTLGTHTIGIANAIGDRTVDLARTIDAQGAAVRDRIDGSLQNVTNVMSDRADMLSSLITSKVNEVNEALGRNVENAIVRIAEAEGGMGERIDTAATSVGESARKAADIIETGVNSARKTITDMVDQRLGTLPEAITARADITAERLAALNSAINTALVQSMTDLDAGADRLEETISRRIVSATADISSEVTATANRMDVAIKSTLEQLQVAGRSIEEIIEVKAVAAAQEVSGRVVEIHKAVDEQTSAFAALVNEKTEQLHIALLNHGNVLRDALGENAREAEDLMSVSSQRIIADVGATLYKLNESNGLLQRVLDASTGNLAKLESTIAEQTATYSTTVREAMISTEQAGKMVTDHVTALQNTIRGMVGEFGSMMGTLDSEAKTLGEAAATLNTAGNFAISNLDERRAAMDALAQSFAGRADDIDARMRGFAQAIADTVNDTERRLVSARAAMDDALNATSGSVANVMQTATANFKEALNATSGSVANVMQAATANINDSLSETTGRVTSALNGTEERFARVFADAEGRMHGVLSGAEDRVNETLSNNAQRVTSALEVTSSNVTGVMTSTSNALADAINANANTVSEALRGATADVAARLADIRGTASSEGQRADEMLRQTQQSMVLEMQKALDDATKRFNETAAAMRSAAKEVSGELEATRTELARGVMELPEETRSSAAAMRRVVAEQIEALSELNDIVRSQSATHDINERRAIPAPQPTPRIEARPEPVRQEVFRAEPQRIEATPAARVEPARVEAPRAPAYQAPAPAPRPAPAPAFQAPRAEPVPAPVYQAAPQPAPTYQAPPQQPAYQPAPVQQFAPAPAPQQPAPAPANRGGDDNGGWLRDVLRNASAKQPGAQPAPQQGGNLSGLTEEIARAIDLNALGDAWGRYQAGEANVFSRRIYTLTGQGTYDEVRKKLQRDPDFANTAQAYMGEFEQLLRRAASGPRPAQESREYLLSDRGKVYTMLAHASGRLN